MKNTDGFSKNWQWTTYDGNKWFVNLYDVDMSFGGHFEGNQITPPITGHVNTNLALPTGYIPEFYSVNHTYGTGALEARYAELRKQGIFTVDHIVGLLSDWVARIGVDAYEKEYKKWPDTPCHGESVVNTAYWKLRYGSDGKPEKAESNTYDKTKAYTAGDACGYGASASMGYYAFEAIVDTTGNPPVAQFKYYDSIYRVKEWLKSQITNMDSLYKYSEEA